MARKDCFGTARNTTSKVWFTVAGGVLSDVFSPNIEATNVNTVQYIVTDGHTFADLQQRDMTYSLASPDRSGMVCQVTSTDRAHGFRLVSEYITDPARASVLVHTTLEPMGGDASAVAKLKVYVRYDATIDNSGGGGTTNGGANDATVDPSSTALVSSDTTAPTGPFAAQVVGALVADHPFLAESSGFVGTPSDGLNQLDTHHALVDDYQSATNGNVVQTALLDTTPGTSVHARPRLCPVRERRHRRGPGQRRRSRSRAPSPPTRPAGTTTTRRCAGRRPRCRASPALRTPP